MIRAFQWDLARQMERLDWLLAQLPRYAGWGYEELYLHLEDAVEYPSLPGVARRDALSRRQLGRLVEAALRVEITVVPIVNLLGHTQYLLKDPALRDLNELRGPDGRALPQGQICPAHPRTLEIAEKLLRDVAPFCTAGKVHVGLDESFQLGRHPLSRQEIAAIGRAAHFARYVGRLRELTRAQGMRMGMWADMLYFLPDAIDQLPADVAVYEWYYYPFTRRPRVELFNFTESAVGGKLRARGMEYWGCPMNGAFRHEPIPYFGDRFGNITSWWRHCQKVKAAGFLVTAWEPNRLAQELTTVVDAATASLWLDVPTPKPSLMLQRGFARVFGKKTAPAAARIALACDRYPFGGYPRWQINSDWNLVSRRESAAPYRWEEQFFRQLLQRSRMLRPRLPAPLQATLVFRWYLAARDRHVRTGGPKPPLRSALAAARVMWNHTRDPQARGPNEEMLRADAGRHLSGSAWQLCYRVNNFAPAAQLVAVEQQDAESGWVTRQACHTIEFQARAAQPRGGLTREHAAPVVWTGDPAAWPALRFVLRGIGQVKIEAVELTDGRKRWPATLPRTQLGQPAPRAGWPALDWEKNQDCCVIEFRTARPERRARVRR
ncbi:MAG: hypothetical protein RIQ93_1996 [Verrucomicrobiota bacterium]|jgi:hypothetical protein